MTLLEQLKDLLKISRQKKRNEFNRVLSVGEYLSDRFEKAAYLGFGEGSSIYDSALVFGDVRVGKNCWIGPFTILDGSGGPLIIGDGCNISAGVQIYTHDTVDKVNGGGERAVGPVTVGRNCYIGPQSVVSYGVEVGEYSVIGALSLVNRSIPPGARVYGTPARSSQERLD